MTTVKMLLSTGAELELEDVADDMVETIVKAYQEGKYLNVTGKKSTREYWVHPLHVILITVELA